MPTPHPHILITAGDSSGLPTVDDLRIAIEERGVRRRMWGGIRKSVEAVLEAEPITPFDPLPGRSAADVTRFRGTVAGIAAWQAVAATRRRYDDDLIARAVVRLFSELTASSLTCQPIGVEVGDHHLAPIFERLVFDISDVVGA